MLTMHNNKTESQTNIVQNLINKDTAHYDLRALFYPQHYPQLLRKKRSDQKNIPIMLALRQNQRYAGLIKCNKAVLGLCTLGNKQTPVGSAYDTNQRAKPPLSKGDSDDVQP